MSDRGEVHTDLVRPTGLERAREAGCSAASSNVRCDFVAGARRPAGLADRHARPARLGPADRRVDRARDGESSQPQASAT